MPVFHYRAMDQAGQVVTGSVDTPDKSAAAAKLQAEGYLPIRVDARAAGGLMALLNTEITPRDALTAKDRIALTRTLATLAGAGLALDRALEMARDLGATRRTRAVAGRLLEAVREGAGLADAFDREGSAFPPLYRAIVRAGEAGASLDTTLARLADTLEEGARRQGELRSALIYPSFLIVTAIGSVAVLLAFVVPTFEPLLEEAGVEPPALTQAVVAAGRFVESYWLAALLALVGAGVATRVALAAPGPRAALHRALLAAPGIGGLWRSFETARFARLLGALLENGVALPGALRLVRGALSNAAFAAELGRVIPEVEAGRGLARPLSEGGIAPPMALQLIEVGEESGQLTAMLAKIADMQEEESRRGFDQAIALLTPALTLVMGGLIAVIVSSILFALLSINELAF
ncbi:MAG: type II secretion system F family protein [Caulobacterales bacterium]|nr:type II secretion system F family protein [Caulobacterales bacterium]